MTILVSAPEGESYTVAHWWEACEQAGLQYGDGNLFWLLNDSASEDNNEPNEYFSVEPYSQPGCFHSGDLNSSVTFPDVALSFRVRDFEDPHAVLEKMAAIAEALANHLCATILASSGAAFDLSAARERLNRAVQEIRALQNTSACTRGGASARDDG
jgi:FtsZ-interacting cell division protein ZipA